MYESKEKKRSSVNNKYLVSALAVLVCAILESEKKHAEFVFKIAFHHGIFCFTVFTQCSIYTFFFRYYIYFYLNFFLRPFIVLTLLYWRWYFGNTGYNFSDVFVYSTVFYLSSSLSSIICNFHSIFLTRKWKQIHLIQHKRCLYKQTTENKWKSDSSDIYYLFTNN